MHWRFDPLFFIRVMHDKYVPDADQEAGNYFRIEPTIETARLMAGLNWVCKPMPNGAFVSVEKNVKSDGVVNVRGKLKQGTFFTFLLYANDPGVLLHTPPYDTGSDPLPAFSGRARVLYFDNLNEANQPDRLVLSRDDKVNKEDLGSIAPNKFRIEARDPLTTQIDFAELRPDGSVVYSAHFSPDQRSALIDLPSGAFRLIPTPANGKEVLLADTELMGNKAIGIIRIYKDENIDYNASVNYTIPFTAA